MTRGTNKKQTTEYKILHRMLNFHSVLPECLNREKGTKKAVDGFQPILRAEKGSVRMKGAEEKA